MSKAEADGTLLVFGAGYSAGAAARLMAPAYREVVATTRSPARAGALAADGLTALIFEGAPDAAPDRALRAAIARARHVLVSAAPDGEHDPVLATCRDALAAAPALRWIGYLSTIGVYGDQGGAWIDETTPPNPGSARSRARVAAEAAWRELADSRGVPLSILRLSGIYGPGRNPLVALAEGTARRLVKPGQVFNRIHRDDIAAAVAAAAARQADGVFNITDDEPAPPQDVVAEAARLAGVPAPPEQPFETAALSPMARSFYGENKRVANALSKRALGLDYRFPTYREGLAALWQAGEGRGVRS